LKDKKQEIIETMKNLRLKHEAFSQKEYEERLQLLEAKFRQIEADISNSA
jgi:hypothetical protein